VGRQLRHGKQEMGGALTRRVHSKLRRGYVPVRPAQAGRVWCPFGNSLETVGGMLVRQLQVLAGSACQGTAQEREWPLKTSPISE